MNNPTDEERAHARIGKPFRRRQRHPLSHGGLEVDLEHLGNTFHGRPDRASRRRFIFIPITWPCPKATGQKGAFRSHDLTFLTNPDLASQESVKTLGSQLEKQEEKADLILTCSDYNRQEMLRHFHHLSESKIRVIPHGLGDPFQPARPGRPGGGGPREIPLLQALFPFCRRFGAKKKPFAPGPLLSSIQAKGPSAARIDPGRTEKLDRGGFHAIHSVPPTGGQGSLAGLRARRGHARPLYRRGRFCFPILEGRFRDAAAGSHGLRRSRPLLNSAAIPEVVGDAAWMMDPSNVGDWSLAMQRIVTEPQFGQLLREKGRTRISLFQVENTAKQTLTALKMAVQSHG